MLMGWGYTTWGDCTWLCNKFVRPFIASTDWYRRLGVGRVKEAWDGAWYQTTRGLRRVAEIPWTIVHPIHKGRPREPRSPEEGASFLIIIRCTSHHGHHRRSSLPNLNRSSLPLQNRLIISSFSRPYPRRHKIWIRSPPCHTIHPTHPDPHRRASHSWFVTILVSEERRG